MSGSYRLGIVGAGPSGLAMARWATELGLEAEILERHTEVGGMWDVERADTPIYDSTHFISSKTRSAFRDFPMPEDFPDYPDHRRIFRYLRDYAEKHGLRDLVRFDKQVEEARPEDGSWVVRTGGGEELEYDGLAVASGHDWEPNLPELPGTFDGEVLHSVEYRSPELFQGRRVLVVGGGNSGCDIAVDAAQNAVAASLSLRRGYHFVPKHIFGRPADVFAHEGPKLPMWLAQPLFGKLLRLLLGDLRRYGLPSPDHRLFETHPIMNTQVLHHLSHGDLRARPDVRELRGDRAIYVDGSQDEIDLVVLATGYAHSIPFLSPEIFRAGDVSELYLRVFHDRHPDLFVLGMFESDGGAYPLVDRQAELVARLVAARRDGSPAARGFERRRARERPDFTAGVKALPIRRMSIYLMTEPYVRTLDRTLELFR